jgi:serine/threonine protein kinase
MEGTLESRIPHAGIPYPLFLQYAREIVSGLNALHEMNVIHRDLKAANILVDSKGVCKISDFGVARILSSVSAAGKMHQMIGFGHQMIGFSHQMIGLSHQMIGFSHQMIALFEFLCCF